MRDGLRATSYGRLEFGWTLVSRYTPPQTLSTGQIGRDEEYLVCAVSHHVGCPFGHPGRRGRGSG